MKNDLRDEILRLPSSLPAPPSVNPCSATFIPPKADGGDLYFAFEAFFSKSRLMAQNLG